MCGIVGVVAERPAAPVLVDGLKRLEYRGYDSAGVATLDGGVIACRRAAGKLENLERRLAAEPLAGRIGIGHTRWATHGAANEANAHPHVVGRVAVVHNGIVENFQELREELTASGARLRSQTDTEIVAHLLDRALARHGAPERAMSEAMARVEGMFALACLIDGGEELLVGARRGAPLALGWGEGETYLASDALALAPYTRTVSFLEEDDIVVLGRDGATILDAGRRPVKRETVETRLSGAAIGKGNHRHFMEKEIFEQPTALGETLARYCDPLAGELRLPGLDIDFAAVPRVTLVACGTAYHAALTAKYWLERLARLPAEADIASEFRYRRAPLPEAGVALFVSQSGETADTLAALRFARGEGQFAVALTNAETSTLAREADAVLPTHAGPEIGVAATKTYTCQLAVLAALALAAAGARGALDGSRLAAAFRSLTGLPTQVSRALAVGDRVRAVAQELAEARSVLYLGRGPAHVLALEGALKLKELSYVHAEGQAAGEMKHGPIALIDEHVPVIVVAPPDELFAKTLSNAREAAAREGRVVLLTDAEGARRAGDLARQAIVMPAVDPLIAPLTYAVPIQLLAYHAALRKGTDVDQPRNLAKSVTVE